MRRRVKIVIAICLVAILGLIGWRGLKEQEPAYQGKALSAWLEESLEAYNTLPPTKESLATRERVGSGLRHIGTNALPLLVKMAGAKQSRLKRLLIVFARKQLMIAPHQHTDEEYHEMAVFGFYALGPLGKDAVPALIDLLRDPDSNVRLHAADCLGDIGPLAGAAVPHLVPFLGDTNRIVRWDATVNLGRIHMESALVVPILINSLNPTNAILPTTISVLGEFGEQAKPAVPALVQLLNSERENVRLEATNALKQIDPEAAAKAGVE
jgi:HEAT repeat protein